MCICTCCITDADFKSKPISQIVPNSRRKCTDAPCWLILITFFLIEMYIIFYAIEEGAEPDSLRSGYDYKGEWCTDNHNEGSLNAWVNIDESYEFRICVHSCEQTQGGIDDRMVVEYESEEYVNAYCIPTDSDRHDLEGFEQFGTYSQEFTRAMADVDDAKWMILICALLTIILGFGYLRVIEYVGVLILWATVVVIYIGGVIAAWLLIANAVDLWEEDEESDIAGWQLSKYLFCPVFSCFLFFILLSFVTCFKRFSTDKQRQKNNKGKWSVVVAFFGFL